MKKHFSNTVLFGWLKHFIGAVIIAIGVVKETNPNIIDWDITVWKGVMISAGYATIFTLGNYLNRNDPRYGRKKKTKIVNVENIKL